MYKTRLASIAVSLLVAALMSEPAFCGLAEDQYTLAARHYSLGRWQLAAQEFEVFLQKYSSHERADNAVFLLGESLVQLQRYADAQPLFQKFLQRAPEHRFAPRAQFRSGETAFLLGDHRTARRALEKFRKLYPQDPLNAYALAYLGEVALDAADGPRAETLYRTALQQFQRGPLEIECRFGMARALELQGKFEEALRFYRFLTENHRGPLADDSQLRTGVLHYKAGEHDLAVAALSSIESSFPDSDVWVDSLYWLGMTRLAQGKEPAALTTLRKAHRADPKHKLNDAILLALADATRQLGDFASAESYCQQLQKTWPDSKWADDAAQILVMLAFDQGDLAGVHRRAQQFVTRHPSSSLLPHVLQTEGRAFLKEERYDAAIERLTRLLKSAPKLASGSTIPPTAQRASHYYLGLAYLGAGQFDEALKALDRVTLHPDDHDLRQGVTVARAFGLVAQKRYAEAVDPLRASLRDRPQGPDAADCRAKLVVSLAETQRIAEAEQVHDEFARLNGSHPLFLSTTDYLARMAHADGKVAFANRLYRMLADADNPPEIIAKGLFGLGKLQMDAGDAEQATLTFAQLTDRAPQTEQAPEAALLRAKLLQSQKQYETALNTYYLIAEKYPKSTQAPAAKFGAARLHCQLKQHEQGLQLLELLVEQYTEFPQRDAVLYQLAWVHKDLGNSTQAESAFRRLSEQYRDSDFWNDATFRLAEYQAKGQHYSRAEELLEPLLAERVEADIRLHALYLKGQLAANQQQWAAVVSTMKRISDDFPDSSLRLPAAYWRAEAQYRLGQYEQAQAGLSKLHTETSKESAAWMAMIPLRLAQVYAHKSDWQTAHQVASTIAGRFPKFRQQYEVDYVLGRCLTNQAKLIDARQAFERVIRSPAGGRTETAAMAQWMIGETFFHQRKYRQAIRAYHRVESLYAFSRWQAAALLQAGKCHELLGDWRLAVGLYAQLLKQHPETEYADEASGRLRIAQQKSSDPTPN